MDKTNLMVYFTLYGNEFPLDEVTEALGIQPTESYNKGDEIRHDDNPNFRPPRPVLRKETAWDISTGYQESYDVSDQLDQILVLLKGKEATINRLKEKYDLECQFSIVIIMERGYTPGFHLEKEHITFANSIGAEFDIDLYANPYEDHNDELESL